MTSPDGCCEWWLGAEGRVTSPDGCCEWWLGAEGAVTSPDGCCEWWLGAEGRVTPLGLRPILRLTTKIILFPVSFKNFKASLLVSP